jgi:hypothetical protein
MWQGEQGVGCRTLRPSSCGPDISFKVNILRVDVQTASMYLNEQLDADGNGMGGVKSNKKGV